MNPSDVRETLTAVSTSLEAPLPDTAAVEARVTRLRRRRASARVVLAAACVGAVALGASLLPRDQPTAPVDPAGEPGASTPVVVDGRLRSLSADDRLGPAGPEVATVVGARGSGVVAFLADGRLAEVSGGDATPLVETPVRTAYLDGADVLYETWGGAVRRLGEDGTVARVDGGRLVAAGDGGYVIAGPDGVVAHDATGAHELRLGRDTDTVRQVRVAGDTVSVVTEDRLFLFSADRSRSASTPGDGIGALAPDGSSYARPTADRRGVELVDAATAAASPVAGLSGTVREVGWTPDGDLLVTAGSRLWRCPAATDCGEVLSGRGPLRLR